MSLWLQYIKITITKAVNNSLGKKKKLYSGQRWVTFQIVCHIPDYVPALTPVENLLIMLTFILSWTLFTLLFFFPILFPTFHPSCSLCFFLISNFSHYSDCFFSIFHHRFSPFLSVSLLPPSITLILPLLCFFPPIPPSSLVCYSSLPLNRNSLTRVWPTWCEMSSTLTLTTKTCKRF